MGVGWGYAGQKAAEKLDGGEGGYLSALHEATAPTPVRLGISLANGESDRETFRNFYQTAIKDVIRVGMILGTMGIGNAVAAGAGAGAAAGSAGAGAGAGMAAGSAGEAAATPLAVGAVDAPLTAEAGMAAGSFGEASAIPLAAGAIDAPVAPVAATAAGRTFWQSAMIWGRPAFSLGSSLFNAYGSYTQGKEQQAALRRQAALQRFTASTMLDSAKTEAMDLTRQRKQLAGRARVAAASNGIMLETRPESIASMYEQDLAAEANYDAQKLFTNANMRARTMYETGATMDVEARRARRLGNLQAASALVKGGISTGLGVYRGVRS